MIVRQRGDHFLLIHQHDHAILAGELAKHLSQTIRPLKETLYAISHHDVGWEKLDQQVLWNKEMDRPYDFMDYPLAPKLQAYENGIAQVEAYSLYAGYLCSKHNAYLLEGVNDPLVKSFLEQEQARRQRMRKYFTNEEKQYVVDNFRLLRFCDDLSLALCLQEPTAEPHSWYKNGISYNGNMYQWRWETEQKLRLTPNPFDESFFVELPFQIIDRNQQTVRNGTDRWQVMI